MFFLKILNSTRYAIVLGAPPRGTRQKRRGTRYTASSLGGQDDCGPSDNDRGPSEHDGGDSEHDCCASEHDHGASKHNGAASEHGGGAVEHGCGASEHDHSTGLHIKGLTTPLNA